MVCIIQGVLSDKFHCVVVCPLNDMGYYIL